MPWPALTAILLVAGPLAEPPRPPGLAADLYPPIRVEAGGRPLDVERDGHAAPFFADLDGDGNPELLVGQYDGGRLRVYPNAGRAGAPRFGAYRWFEAGGSPASVRVGCCIGFTPQAADLDGDGRLDVLSGSWPGEVSLFRGRPDGSFAAAELLVGTDGQPIRPGPAAAAFAADWDGDGKPDLIVGTHAGEVFLLPNRGTWASPAFGRPTPLSAGAGSIRVPSGLASPAVADWDGDGKPDLLVGAEDGSVVWFRNAGGAAGPELAAAGGLVPPSRFPWQDDGGRNPGEWGVRARPCVADWDGDGRPDLLVGDRCGGFEAEPAKTPVEAADEKAAAEKLPGLRVRWAEAYREFAAAADGSEPTDPAARDARRRQADDARAWVVRLRDELAAAQDVVDRYRPMPMTHGYVWLFRRRPADPTESVPRPGAGR